MLKEGNKSSIWKQEEGQERVTKMKVLAMLMKYRGVNKVSQHKKGQQESLYSAQECKIWL